MALYQWSKTATDNDDAVSTINLREGWSPSVVNNSIRALMADVAKARDDTNGSLTTTGTLSAFALTTNSNITAEAAVPDGFEVACIMHLDSGPTPTLEVDGQDPSPITYKPGFAPDAGMMELGSIQRFRYVLADDEWRMQGVVARDTERPGVEKNYYGASLPSGYVWANGTTIGNASSSATGLASASAAALFTVLWGGAANTEFPIQDSSGTPTSRGVSAAADFAANKRLPVPDRKDKASIGKGTMGGVAAAGLVVNTSPVSIDTTKIGATGGADRDTITKSKLPALTLPVTESPHHHGFGGPTVVTAGTGLQSFDAPGAFGAGGITTTADASTGISVALDGGGLAHNNMPPCIVCNVIIKL